MSDKISSIAIMSDIHGNLQALEAVMNDAEKYSLDGIILLGDLIDYGQQSNEVVHYLQEHISCPIICNLWGNHEKAIFTEDYGRFSSQRGKDCAKHTASILEDSTKKYLETSCEKKCFLDFKLAGKHCLSIHGSLEDPAWKGIVQEDLQGNYQDYDVVFSGHTHYAHCFTKFYESNDERYRNKKAVLFINPGSVGQPRNHNPNAQYAVLEIPAWSVSLRSVPYDISGAMGLFHGQVDDFYRDRMKWGV